LQRAVALTRAENIPAQKEQPVKHIYEISLVTGIMLSALAFGGTEMPYFSVVQLMFLGLSFLLLATHNSPMTRGPKLPVVIPFLLVVFVLAQCVQFPSLRNSPDSIASSAISVAPYETLSHFLILVTYLAAFYLTIFVYRQSNGRRLIFALLGLGAFEACCGLFQYLTGRQQIFAYTKTVNLEMATGTYINYNHFAGLLEMILPFALACSYDQYQKIPSFHSPTGRLRSFFLHEESHKLILWLFLAIVFLVAIVFSESRMGLVSAVISTFFLVILVIPFGQQRIAVAYVTLAILAVALAMAVWIGPEPVINRFLNLSRQESALTGENRKAIWRDTVQLIDGHPWLGTGLGTFSLAYPSVQTAFAGKSVNHAHNDYLEFASELGIPATVLLFGAVFYVLLQSARTFRGSKIQFEKTVALGCFGSLFAISLHSLTDFNLQIPANALIFAVVLGLAHANSSAARRAPSTATIACNLI
jgi:putative inorganic carbon (hco3(-)) transporter